MCNKIRTGINKNYRGYSRMLNNKIFLLRTGRAIATINKIFIIKIKTKKYKIYNYIYFILLL